MAKIKVRREGNLLWEDECQPLTTEQMNDIKSQFHPSNTANVNIVPYEIYDEDGVEQVVGEVRKTIDGVKKRKPLYEKTFSGGALSTGTTIIDTLANVEMITKSNHCIYNKSNQAFPEYSLSNNTVAVFLDGTSVKINIGTGWTGNDAIISYNVTFRYTKTTDTWQPV